jgi:hypothetical protein
MTTIMCQGVQDENCMWFGGREVDNSEEMEGGIYHMERVCNQSQTSSGKTKEKFDSKLKKSQESKDPHLFSS